MILITGAAGFIGSHLLASWQERAAAVPAVVVDVLGQGGKWHNLKNRELYRLYPPPALEQCLAENGALARHGVELIGAELVIATLLAFHRTWARPLAIVTLLVFITGDEAHREYRKSFDRRLSDCSCALLAVDD
jgi:nucleoside-diphosphate-sugar epimerase